VLANLGRDCVLPSSATSPPRRTGNLWWDRGASTLQAEHGFATDHVEVIAPPLIARLVGRSLPPNASATYARLCTGYAIAKVLQFGKLDLADFRGDALFDPATHGLAARVETRIDGNPDPNALARYAQTVVVHLMTGAALRWECAAVLASASAHTETVPGEVPSMLHIFG
jgi:2-methylcitrate dehydratase PrpD